jgi:hypothetical protein
MKIGGRNRIDCPSMRDFVSGAQHGNRNRRQDGREGHRGVENTADAPHRLRRLH